jgi:hypothetical protein
MLPFTLLISGPIQSRLDESITETSLLKSFEIIKSLDPRNQIVFSTYENEVPDPLIGFADEIVINRDPGPDYFRVNPWPIGGQHNSQSANFSRLLQTTTSGLRRTNTPIVIKTRVELVPENFQTFRDWYLSTSESIASSNMPLISFFLEHYSGISFSVDGLLGGIPDTLQIGRRDTLLQLWECTEAFWLKNSDVLTRKNLRYPITSEQILGLNYLQLHCGFPISAEIRRLRRNYTSFTLIKSLLLAEQNYFRWSEYKSSGFSANYLRGTLYINTARFEFLSSRKKIVIMLSKVFLRRLLHHNRRLLRGLRRQLLG